MYNPESPIYVSVSQNPACSESLWINKALQKAPSFPFLVAIAASFPKVANSPVPCLKCSILSMFGYKTSLWLTHHHPLPKTYKVSPLCLLVNILQPWSLGLENSSGSCFTQINLLLYYSIQFDLTCYIGAESYMGAEILLTSTKKSKKIRETCYISS